MTLSILLAVANACLIFVLLVPSREQRYTPWDDAPGPIPRATVNLVARQLDLMQGAGVTMHPKAFLAMRIGCTAGGAFVMGVMLGPVSAVCGGVAAWLAVQEWLKTRRETRLLHFADQFRETLQSIANSLRAGKSLQQALMQSYEDLTRVPGAEHELLASELARIIEEMRLGATPDAALKGLVCRVPLEEVRLFADAVTLCRVRGGNIVLVLQTLIRLNVDRFQVRQEVRVQSAQKRGEGTVLSAMPLVLLVVLSVVAPEYMAPLTRTAGGQALVGIGLFFVLAAYLVGRTMTRIEV